MHTGYARASKELVRLAKWVVAHAGEVVTSIPASYPTLEEIAKMSRSFTSFLGCAAHSSSAPHMSPGRPAHLQPEIIKFEQTAWKAAYADGDETLRKDQMSMFMTTSLACTR